MKELLILGAGGFAREVATVLYSIGARAAGYLSDDVSQHNVLYEYARCVGAIEMLEDAKYRFIPGIGSPALRRQLVSRALAKNWIPESAVSAQAHMPAKTRAALNARKGTVVCSGTSATINVAVGDYVNVNLNCTLGHDCVLEDYVNLSPSVNVSGHVYIEHGADIGTGAVLLPGVRIGAGAIIGANATVTKDVPPGEVWAGTPARKMK